MRHNSLHTCSATSQASPLRKPLLCEKIVALLDATRERRSASDKAVLRLMEGGPLHIALRLMRSSQGLFKEFDKPKHISSSYQPVSRSLAPLKAPFRYLRRRGHRSY